MEEDNKRKKKSRRMKERKETTLLVDKFLSLKNIVSTVSIIPIFFLWERWDTRTDDYKLPKYKKIMLLKFLDIDSSGRTNCLTCGTRNRSPFLISIF